ncbi:MAG: nitroreductase family protein [Sphingomonas sp.]|uniref:nitroreductase family protein n=1 Tax=Sphingomonas sp. TaxID=28214 RepID=UPI001B1DFCE1|nr:nitroreductase family protein [Sphingomonas sp.]MBO9622613.1 nitroreductase family protein [Sphingomonas sp.]
MDEFEALPWQPYPEMDDGERIARAQAFSASMRRRRSCRAFSDQPVPQEVIEAALHAAASAPNGANRQPWHFCVVTAPEARTAIRVAVEEEERAFYAGRAGSRWLEALSPLGTHAEKPYLETAPWLIVVFAVRRTVAEHNEIAPNYYVSESVGIACGLLLATLHEAGVATLVHTPAPMGFLNRVCGRPTSEKPVMMIVAGHPAPDATVPALDKKPLEQITTWL